MSRKTSPSLVHKLKEEGGGRREERGGRREEIGRRRVEGGGRREEGGSSNSVYSEVFGIRTENKTFSLVYVFLN